MKIYVGNLPLSTTDNDLRTLFEAHGQVTSASVVMDRETGRPRGFGFVEMGTKEDAESAIQKLNGTELKGRTITVNEARPKTERSFGGGGGGGNRGGQRARF